MSRWAFQNIGITPYYLTHQNREQMNKFLSKLSATEVFELHLVLQEFSSFKSCLGEEEQSTLPLAYCHLWFEDSIKEWFSVALSKIRGRIYFAMEHDKELHGLPLGIVIDVPDEGPKPSPDVSAPAKVKYSSSSVETVQSYNQLKEFWQQLMWPDKYTAYPFILLIVEATTAGIVLYSNLLWKRLRDDPNSYAAKGHFNVTRKVILYMNNLENALNDLHYLEDELCVKDVVQAIRQKEHQAAAELLSSKIKLPIEETLVHVRTMIDCFVRSVSHLMNYKIKKLMFHLAWGPEKLEPEQSIAPLLGYLEKIFLQLKVHFLHNTFQRLVQAIWLKVLDEYSSTATKNIKEKPSFFRNLYVTLNILTEFFLGDVAMLPLEELQCQIYKNVEREVRIQQSDTLPLIEYYYISRTEEQFNSREAPLGYLTVKAVYNEKKTNLLVEVMNARGLLPCDPNGLSDPFVIMQMVPKHLFPNSQVQKTSIHMKTLNPIFMETFDWSVTPEQYQNRNTSISFVVMDYDYMRKNDFEGEGYYPLYKVKNSADDTRTPEPMELILTCPNFRSDILIALGKRTWDRDAMRLVAAERKKS